ncbi:MAG TPA: cysteine synthase A [Terriglobales bacterium]|nr:cysteine synthase A [Terriglobales bacterium]
MKLQEATRLRTAESVIELVGETPLLHLNRLVPSDSADVYAKLEYLNPGGSIKDRAAIGMIRRAEETGELKEGSTIIEATAGNTGIGLALIGVNKGYRVIFCVPQKFSKEKVMIMQALGAEVIRTPDSEGMGGAIKRARELAAKIPNSYLPLQFENQANPDYHYETTGRELVEQMGGRVDAVVIGAGTGGTFSGVARYEKEHCEGAIAIAVETVGSILGGGPPGDHKIEGIGSSFIPKTFHGDLADQIIAVKDADAFEMVRQLARQEGVMAGSSGGANTWVALQIAKRLGPGKRVATVIPDSAERYLSKNIFETY